MIKTYKRILFTTLIFASLTVSSLLQAGDEKTFPTPQAALQGLSKAVQSDNVNAALSEIFGKNNTDLWSTGDPTQDAILKKRFLERLQQGHQFIYFNANHRIIYLGKDNWAFPIPLIKEGKKWAFDTKMGRDEILNRRVGANELSAIQSVKDYVKAQKDYASLASSQGKYAQKFLSDPGKKNGLYWPASSPQDTSPLGAKVMAAVAEGYKSPSGNPVLLYHGYYYRMFPTQGKDFGLIAYPAKWDNSGVMTFQVNQNGQVMQKNLGKDTLDLAAKITSYAADSTWKKVN